MKYFVFLFVLIPICESAKILSIFTVPSPSHYIYGSALLKELASRGHEVTSINVYPQKTPIKNFRDIFIENNTHVIDEFIKSAQDGSEQDSIWNAMKMMLDISQTMSINIFEHPEVRELLKNPKGKFDLLIIEAIWTDSMYGLAEHFNVPMIGVSTFGTVMGVDELVGNMSPNSVIPSPLSIFNLGMTFFTRVENMYINIRTYYMNYYINYYNQKNLYHKYLPYNKLDFDATRINFALIILNQHHSLSFPRPYVTNMIEAGGLHIKKNPDPLPNDLQKWLDDAPDGVVYFSMGSNIKSKDLPPHIKDIFLNVFRKLKQKVLWKFEDPHLPNKPDNVLINPWLPQHSVLNHPNVKVFMTHGGLLSTTEAIFFGKPILGIPMFGDQTRNIKFAGNRGIALSINLSNLNEKDLSEALNQLLYNPKYSAQMKSVSAHFHDQPLTPMDTAVYWVEYVLRHGGDHLRNAGVELNIFQYYSVDVVAFYLGVIVFILTLAIYLIKKIIGTIKLQSSVKRKEN